MQAKAFMESQQAAPGRQSPKAAETPNQDKVLY